MRPPAESGAGARRAGRAAAIAPRLARLRRRYLDDPLARNVVEPYRRWRNSGREFRPIFIAGAMGSGTTLLALALGQRYECAGVVTESALQIAPGSFLRMGLVATYPSVAAYRDAILPRAGWSSSEGRAQLLELYRAHAVRDAVAIVDKGPNTNLVRARFLQECFPEGRFALIFRDPVANVEGFRRKWSTFGRDSLGASIEFYREIHERFLDAAPALREPPIMIEYERLVERHDRTLAALAAALGLEPARSGLRLEARENEPGQGIRNVRAGRIEVVADANERAYRGARSDDVSRIREALGSLHARMRALALP